MSFSVLLLFTDFHSLLQAREDLVLQREFSYCIIDEVDSILIDEARTPLIISGESDKAGKKYEMAAKIGSVFERDFHYTVDEKAKSVVLQERGYEDAEAALAVRAALLFLYAGAYSTRGL